MLRIWLLAFGFWPEEETNDSRNYKKASDLNPLLKSCKKPIAKCQLRNMSH